MTLDADRARFRESAHTRAPSRVVPFLGDLFTIRQLRVVSGLVLFCYLLFHFLNHALGNISLQAMMWGAEIHEKVWHGAIAGSALYTALSIHFLLALLALYQRRTFRMGWGEIIRLVFGFSIVPLLVHHYLAARWVYSTYAIARRYDVTLLAYFTVNPFYGGRQILVLIVAWIHGCLGIHYWLRHRPGYRKLTPVLLASAVLLPALALLGVAQGAREVARLAQDPTWKASVIAQGHLADAALGARIWDLELTIYCFYAAAIGLVFFARDVRQTLGRRRGGVSITYPNGAVVRIQKGLSVLDASRSARIPHTSICGGRGRCSTCRVRVLRGFEGLPPPRQYEAAVLAKFRAAPSVRLACQLRPTGDITVLPLLPPNIATADGGRNTAGSSDVERFVAIMFIDIRASTALVEKRLPYDVIFLLNHFFEAVGGAVAAVGGVPNQFLGDGMMAIFGMDCKPRDACRQALAAAGPVFRRLREMNQMLAADLPEPINIGIGIHAGNVILGELGYRERYLLTAIGDTVHVAARLQELTKEYACQAVVSDIVGEMAGVELSGLPTHEIHLRGREAPQTVRMIKEVERVFV